MEAILGALEILPLDAPADSVHAGVRTRLEQVGQPIGGNDLLIGSQALALDCILVTDNEREFGRITELTWENWLG